MFSLISIYHTTIINTSKIGETRLNDGDSLIISGAKNNLNTYLHISKGFLLGNLSLTYTNESGTYVHNCVSNEHLQFKESDLVFSFHSSFAPVNVSYYVLPSSNLSCGTDSIFAHGQIDATIRFRNATIDRIMCYFFQFSYPINFNFNFTASSFTKTFIFFPIDDGVEQAMVTSGTVFSNLKKFIVQIQGPSNIDDFYAHSTGNIYTSDLFGNKEIFNLMNSYKDPSQILPIEAYQLTTNYYIVSWIWVILLGVLLIGLILLLLTVFWPNSTSLGAYENPLLTFLALSNNNNSDIPQD